MNRTAKCTLLLLWLFSLAACRVSTKTEQEEKAYWHKRFADSAYHLLYKEKDTVNALRFFDSALQRENKPTIYPKAVRADLLANYYYFFTTDNRMTAAWIDSALLLYNTPELQNQYPRSYVGLLLFGGNIAYRLSQYNKANDYYFRAKKLADAHLSPCEKTSFNYSIAMVLYRQQNFRQSLAHFEEAFALQETCSPQTTAIVLQQQEIQSNIGLCFVHLRSYDSAMVHFEKALQLADRYRDSLGAATMDKIYGVVYGNMAQVALASNRLAEAEQLSRRSIALNDKPNYEKENAQFVKLQLAEVYARQQDLQRMAGVLRSCDPQLRQHNAKLELEWRRLTAAYYEQKKLVDSTLYFSKNYFLLKDALEEEQKQLTAADVDRQLREKEGELQIALLKSEKRMTQITLWVAIIFSCMFLVIIYLVYQNYRRSKKSLAVSLALNEEIKRQKAAREEEARQRHKLITEAVIEAQETERSLIGLELHDNINQVLTTVKLHNEMLLEGLGDAKVILPRAVQYLQNCINEIRSLSKRLAAPTLGKISLEESVKDLISSINLTSKVKITTRIAGIDGDGLTKEVHIGLYRILQEQLNNVLKHAEASEVVVRLEQNKGKIRLSVADNGKGFEVPASKSGIGLLNMQTRAESLSGTFVVKSRPGQGCRIDVEIPCLQ